MKVFRVIFLVILMVLVVALVAGLVVYNKWTQGPLPQLAGELAKHSIAVLQHIDVGLLSFPRAKTGVHDNDDRGRDRGHDGHSGHHFQQRQATSPVVNWPS